MFQVQYSKYIGSILPMSVTLSSLSSNIQDMKFESVKYYGRTSLELNISHCNLFVDDLVLFNYEPSYEKCIESMFTSIHLYMEVHQLAPFTLFWEGKQNNAFNIFQQSQPVTKALPQ